jgi:hypothetical protein
MSWPARVLPCARSRRSPKGFLPKPTAGWLGVWDYLVHNSAKLKILQSADIYPVVKVRPLAESRRNLAIPSPAIRWSVGLFPRIRGAMMQRHENDGSISPSRRLGACARAAWGCAPRYSISVRCLPGQRFFLQEAQSGGDEETRTPDPLLAKEMLCQLSYVPRTARKWWAILDSNQ